MALPNLPGQAAQKTWPSLLALDLGFSVNAVVYWGLIWWHESEGTPDSWHNPMATTYACCGGVNVNSAGVKKYPTWDAGMLATAHTLRLSYYTDVVRELKQGNSLLQLWKAINASPWCKGCQGGTYPTVIYKNLGASAPPVPGGQGGGTVQGPTLEQQWDWSQKVEHTGQAGKNTHPRVMAAVNAMHNLRK